MNNNGGNRFFDGFLLGVLVGALAFYLFGTKSGKRIVKILSEEGMEGLQKVVADFQEAQEEDKAGVKVEGSGIAVDELVETKTTEKPKKRFFRRFKRVD